MAFVSYLFVGCVLVGFYISWAMRNPTKNVWNHLEALTEGRVMTCFGIVFFWPIVLTIYGSYLFEKKIHSRLKK